MNSATVAFVEFFQNVQGSGLGVGVTHHFFKITSAKNAWYAIFDILEELTGILRVFLIENV